MIYTPDIGQVYDTIYYGIIYFNKPIVTKIFTEFEFNLDNAFTFYNEVKNSCKPLPQCLYPFFYYNGVKSSVLIDYMRNNLDFHKHTIDNYFNLIQNKVKLKEYAFNHLFDNLSEMDRENLINKDSRTVLNVFQNQAWPSDLKEQMIFLIHHFPYVSDLLYEHLSEVNKYVTELHNKYKATIKKRFQEIADKDILIMFEKLYLLNEKAMNKQLFSICLMNQFVIFNENSGHKEFVFILGNQFKENLLFRSKDKPVPIDKFFYVLGDPIRFNVIQLLKQYGQLTLSDISRLANISTSTAFNVVNILADNLVIHENHREGRKIYFSLNLDFFISSRGNFDEYISNITSIKKGIENDGEHQKYKHYREG